MASCIGASGGGAGDVDQDHGQAALPERPGELGGVGDDLLRRVDRGEANDAFL